MEANPVVPEIRANTGVIQHKDAPTADNKPTPNNLLLFGFMFSFCFGVT